jgi:hypothetical protein
MGDTAYLGYTVHYARFPEYGIPFGQGRTAHFFTRGAAQLWPQIVDRAVAKQRGSG